jgi:hypothetical protein
VENVRSPKAIRRESAGRFYGTLTCRLRPELPTSHIDCAPRHDLAFIGQARGNELVSHASACRGRSHCAPIAGVCHCATMTSPCLMPSARTCGIVDDHPFGPHQMTAWAAQRRRDCPPSRWEPHQFTDRRHRATVSVIPACDIKKSRGLAEKISACGLSTAGLGQAERTEYSEFSRAGNTTEC